MVRVHLNGYQILPTFASPALAKDWVQSIFPGVSWVIDSADVECGHWHDPTTIFEIIVS